MRLDDVHPPETAAAVAAREVASAYCTPALYEHSVRSYLWAVGFAEAADLGFDAELLYVAAMLHDVGLVKEFDAHTEAFEHTGGHVAWVLTAGAGWPVRRRTRAAEVVVRHMWPEVDPAVDPEGHLLEIATGLDISGARAGQLPDAYVTEVLAAHPRGALAAEFTACLTDQAARKPATAAARLVAGGLAGTLAQHPLER